MQASIGTLARRILSRPAHAAVFAAITLAGMPAHAQDTANSGGSFWNEERLRVQRVRPMMHQTQRVRRLMPHRELARPTFWTERPVAAVPPPAASNPPSNVALTPPPAAPAADAIRSSTPPFIVAVVGDNLAQWLTAGLNEAFPPGGDITVLGRARDSSGLVRDDFYDWPKALRDLLADARVDALVVMIGSNDRQPLRGATGPEEPLSPGWEALYAKRIETLLSVAKEKSVPVVWVGMPIMKSERFAADMGAINAIDRARGESAGATFIDVYDAFADEKGHYSAFGPDVNGQYVKLRTGDGIHFTPPGARKLAHFVEGDLRRLREATHPHAPVAPEVAALPAMEIPVPAAPAVVSVPAAPEKPAIGPIIPLTMAPVSPGGDLAGRPGVDGRITDAQRAAVETLLVRSPSVSRTIVPMTSR